MTNTTTQKKLKRHNIDLKDPAQVDSAYWDDNLFCSSSQRSDVIHSVFRQDVERAKRRKQFEHKSKKDKKKGKSK